MRVPNPGVDGTNRLMSVGTVPGAPSVAAGMWAVGSYSPRSGAPSQTLVESLPPAAYPGPAPIPISYWETSIDFQAHYDLGYSAAQHTNAGVIMLNYGEPKHVYCSGWTACNGWGVGDHYYTSLPGTHDLALIDEGSDFSVLQAAEAFASGYHSYFTDTISETPVITLALSITNDNQDNGAALTAAHANLWAKMVQDVQAYLYSNGMTEIAVAAGISIHPSWSSYSAASTWVQGYTGSDYASSDVYNFGTTDGYPALAGNESEPAMGPAWAYSDWTNGQLYDVSGGLAGTLAFPQIFQPTWARSWAAVKRWSIDTDQAVALHFEGQMSDCQANQASPCAISLDPGVYFTPEQSYQVLWQELNGDPDASVHQTIDLITDVACSNGETNESCVP
jgi:hypothetical protein